MSFNKKKVWLFQIPRLNDELTAGIKEVCNILQKNKTECEIIDINHAIYKKFYNSIYWKDMEEFGIQKVFSISHIPLSQIDVLFQDMEKKIKKDDVVILSVFSTESRSWAILFLILLHKHFKKTIRVGLGGSGLRDPGETGYECQWADQFLKSKLCDFLFLGESSITLKQQIDNNFSINGKLYEQNNIFPDLGFLPLHLIRDDKERFFDGSYHSQNTHGEIIQSLMSKKTAKIHFTQGCVKKCTFCDVPFINPKWSMRKAEKVIEEIDYYYNLDKIVNFSFPDNTINGSNSEFLKFLKLLDKWQEKNEKITWSSQFSIKPKEQQPDIMFELLAKTGAKLNIGFDHCSNEVLKHMNKLYRWEDSQHFILKSFKHKVNIGLAMWIVGYPTETLEQFLEYTKLIKFLENHKKLIAAHNVLVCSVNKNSKLLDYVSIDWSKTIEWKSHNGLDKDTRVKRKKWLDDQLLQIEQNYYKFNTTNQRLGSI